VERVTVALPDASYDVVIGPGALGEIAGTLSARRQVVVVSQQGILDALGEQLPWPHVVIGDGEDAKSLDTVELLCREFAQRGLLRGDAVVALGGGVVGDTAGFAAAVYCRGVAVVQAPTTLLSQVDAAIGGKTAVNIPEGKNLVGAFHQPIAVAADVTTLATLPAREFRAGLGEVAKYACMPQGTRVAEIIRDRPDAIVARDPGALTELVAACVAIKGAVVAADPEERTGLRATLNYGHTLAHALETVGAYELLHGEAVAIGLGFADALARAMERVDTTTVDQHRQLVDALGLPTSVPDGASARELLAVMRRDKKAKGGLTFVLPGADGLETVDDPPPNALSVAFRAVGIDPDVEG
jgi:5-deoxy-5-amino-3-dehydroquinate synthase